MGKLMKKHTWHTVINKMVIEESSVSKCHSLIPVTTKMTTKASRIIIIITSRSAITGNPYCSAFKLGPKYNCEKRASNIALSYGVALMSTNDHSSVLRHYVCT